MKSFIYFIFLSQNMIVFSMHDQYRYELWIWNQYYYAIKYIAYYILFLKWLSLLNWSCFFSLLHLTIIQTFKENFINTCITKLHLWVYTNRNLLIWQDSMYSKRILLICLVLSFMDSLAFLLTSWVFKTVKVSTLLTCWLLVPAYINLPIE